MPILKSNYQRPMTDKCRMSGRINPPKSPQQAELTRLTLATRDKVVDKKTRNTPKELVEWF